MGLGAQGRRWRELQGARSGCSRSRSVGRRFRSCSGENAFAHEAGIHQDGYLKNKSTYEIIDPKSVGVPEGKLVLGKHSGRHALKQRCADLGYPELSREELDVVYKGFCELADRVKGVRNESIAALCKEATATRVNA